MQQLAQKARHSPEVRKTVARDFVLWLAKQGIALGYKDGGVFMGTEVFGLIDTYSQELETLGKGMGG